MPPHEIIRQGAFVGQIETASGRRTCQTLSGARGGLASPTVMYEIRPKSSWLSAKTRGSTRKPSSLTNSPSCSEC